MSTILLTYRRPRSPRHVLMSQQAIVAALRTILAARLLERPGMLRSDHQILAPANLDILPLLALVANDYSEFVEPEPGQETRPVPFVLYWDGSLKTEADDAVARRFMQARWMTQDPIMLADIIEEYKPKVAVVIGEAPERLEGRNGHRVNTVFIASRRLTESFSSFADRAKSAHIFVADEALEEKIRTLDPKIGIEQARSMWQEMYVEREQALPDLEEFIPFGISLEMAMFPQQNEQ